jgi:2-dehydropantoate 2-reductase
MRIAVMAAGAVGGYFGARLAAAGHDVIFFARGAHLEALRANGLTVESALGDLHLPAVSATDDPSIVAPVDLVLFAVKLWDTERAAETLRPLIAAHTRVITVQNGVDSVERLAPILGAEAVVGGSTYVVSTIARPGVIRHNGTLARILCGRLDGRADERLADYVREIKTAGIDIVLSEQMELDLWKKFVLLSGTSGITASTRQPLGVIRNDPDMRAFFFTLMTEVMAVGRASGVAFPADFPQELERSVERFPDSMRASMANDLAQGKRLELDWLAGKVVALGRELGVPTPANVAVYAILKPYRMGSDKPETGPPSATD